MDEIIPSRLIGESIRDILIERGYDCDIAALHGAAYLHVAKSEISRKWLSGYQAYCVHNPGAMLHPLYDVIYYNHNQAINFLQSTMHGKPCLSIVSIIISSTEYAITFCMIGYDFVFVADKNDVSKGLLCNPDSITYIVDSTISILENKAYELLTGLVDIGTPVG